MTDPVSSFNLTPTMLERAQLLNPYYWNRLNWPLPTNINDVTSVEFAKWVAKEQSDSGTLRIDGILGPKTWSHLRGDIWRPHLGDYLIVGAERVPTPLPVVNFKHPEGLSFYGSPGWEPRDVPLYETIDLLVLHWDGCRSSHDCFHVLLHRGLSVHLLMDEDGTLYQALDLLEARAWHVRGHNERSIGIEIQNPWRSGKDLRDFDHDLLSTGRDVVEEQIPHSDRIWQHLDFTEAQKSALKVWVPFLCTVLGIPQILPVDSNGNVLTSLCSPEFTGVCGHYHLQTNKVDPGLSLWSMLKTVFETAESETGK